MTNLVEYCLEGIGAIVFAVGYFRKNRNFMLAGAIVLALGVGWQDVVKGWQAAG